MMQLFSLPFRQLSSPHDEKSIHYQGDPQAYVLTQSLLKAEALAKEYKEAAILTADTVVHFNGTLYEKPESRKQAEKILTDLSNNWHEVYTGVALHYQGDTYQGVELTRVLFNPLSAKEIECYLDKIHWKDKAGGYAIQAAGGLLINRIEGSYENVVGFPINTVSKLLNSIGINLWNYIKDL